jgi:hypothetical protein
MEQHGSPKLGNVAHTNDVLHDNSPPLVLLATQEPFDIITFINCPDAGTRGREGGLYRTGLSCNDTTNSAPIACAVVIRHSGLQQ